MSVAFRSQTATIAKQSASAAGAEDESDVSALIARLTAEVNQVACEKTKSIQKITNQMKMLALNALIESSRAGAQGAGFAVVAQEVRNVGQQVETIARELESQLTNRTGNLMTSIAQMADRSRGERMVDLSLNAIELIDRNLYERTCDVRWWATDSAVVDCAAAPEAAAVAHASVLQELVDHPRQGTAQPFAYRRREALFRAVDDGCGNVAFEQLSQQMFAPALPQLQRRRNRGGELEQLVIEQRVARFERNGHAHLVDLGQDVIDQIRVDVHVQRAIERV